MKLNKYFNFFGFFLLIFFAAANFSPLKAQNLPAPRESKLLNGARLLVWNDKQTDKVTVKIRIHSGSAFDPLGKEGTMQLLSDILFPSETTREFFTEDLNGSFEIVTNYDYIQINASGDADRFLSILETLASGITNPQIDKETTEKVKAARRAKVLELEKNPAYVADRAVAKRLLGNFPYGRPQMGSPESLQKIDFADLLIADQKFLTADNATIAVSGNVNPDFALRAARRLLGGWLKADKKVPATFAQPDDISGGTFFVELPDSQTAEIRQAVRGIARNDKDFAASLITLRILQERFQNTAGGITQAKVFVKNDYHLLPGIMIFGGSVPAESAKNFVETSQKAEYFKPLTQDEFIKAKNAVISELKAQSSTKQTLADAWLDIETYKLAPIGEQIKNAENTTFQDSEKILDRFFRKTNFVSVLVGDPNKLKELADSNNSTNK